MALSTALSTALELFEKFQVRGAFVAVGTALTKGRPWTPM